MHHGWLNIYKCKGISSGKVVAIVKKAYKGYKVGHAGTLDVEAEGVLPIAVGEATKLVRYLVSSRKRYMFTVQFGASTTTDDFSGEIIATTEYIPSAAQCHEACQSFIGHIDQVPSAFSAIKVNGKRAYKLARENHNLILPSRIISIYSLECLNYDATNKTATYITECSKGTYIRALAKDIALSLQSLGFVIELRRIQVGVFKEEDSLNIKEFEMLCLKDNKSLYTKLLKIETVLDDIPVLDVDQEVARKIKFGQKCFLQRNPTHEQSESELWIRYSGKLLAIGSIKDNCFNSSRVFNLISITNGEIDVDNS